MSVIRKGFWDLIPNYDFSEMIKNDRKYNCNKFLHGFCDIFALKLFDLCKNCKISIVKTKYELVHSFITFQVDGIKYYMDVRGITSNIDEFFEEFEDYFDYQGYFYYYDEFNNDDGEILEFSSKEDYLYFMNDFYNDNNWVLNQKEILDEINSIIKAFKNYYVI